MLFLQLFLLSIIGFIGIIFNWLFILAIQRKTYHYQNSQRIPSPIITKSILRHHSSLSAQTIQPPLLPSLRSSLSIFDKFILAFLINDILVCNFLLPLRLVEISNGLPCGFLCFILKFSEKLTAMIELIIVNFLLITSLIYFWKKRSLSTKFWFILIVLFLPIIISVFLTTLIYVDVDEYELNNRPPTCKQTFIYMDITTQKALNIFCCLIAYLIIFINFVLIIKIKYAIKEYKQNALKTFTEAVVATKPESSSFDQVPSDFNRRRSMYYFPSLAIETATPSATPPIQSSFKPIDYIAYLTVVENSHTLIRSTCLILFVYLLFYIPYWFYELSNNEILFELKDLYFLCHIFKPFCYMLTNEKYRHHVWAIIRCKTFRVLPNAS